MALIHSKQLNPKLTGSFILSGSDGLSVIGGLTSDFVNVSNHLTASGEIKAEGRIIAQADVSASGNLFVTQNVDIDGTSNFAGDVVLQNNLAVAGHITASGNISNVSTTHVTASGNVEVGQYIKHKGDTNTFINFTDNRIRFQAGGIAMLGMHKDGDAPYPVTVNNGGNRVNFRVNDRNTDLLFKTDSEAYNVGLYYAGNKKLETGVGGVDITGHVTASGNISGSATSTGSFGKISMVDNTHLNSNGFAISGSATSTASFGMVKIHAIAGNSPITFTDTIIENQNIEVVGHITASSNISASGNITATGDIIAKGDIVAESFIVKSTVTSMTQSFSSGSTIFGDDISDTHRFTGSLVVTGSLNLENGRIFEQGSSVIDHATAMAIVFGG